MEDYECGQGSAGRKSGWNPDHQLRFRHSWCSLLITSVVLIHWAFHETVQKSSGKIEKRLIKEGLSADWALRIANTPKYWLRRSHHYYLIATGFFFFQLILDATNPNGPIESAEAFFIGGALFLIGGVIQTYRVIEFCLNPEYRPEFHMRDWGRILALGISGGLNLGILVTALVAKPFNLYTTASQIYLIAIVPSILMANPRTLDWFQWKLRPHSVVAFALFLLPWIILAFEILFRLQTF